MAHKYSKEQVEFLTNNFIGRGNAELTEIFNKHFNLDLKISQIKAFKTNRKLSSGLDGRFKKGNIPFNKGVKGLGGWEPTQFRKGHKPLNHKPIGSERINVDGYIEIKVAEPNKWKLKHRIVWEKHNGAIPKNYNVIFGDGDKLNLNIDNLILVSKEQLLILNRNKLIQNDADLTRTGVIIADLYKKISEKKAKAK